MSRRGGTDVAVVGAGIVGAAAALALAREGASVVLYERQPPPAWAGPGSDLRVVALAADSLALLDGLGVWPGIAAAAQPYRRMEVWDAGSPARLVFDAAELGCARLGAIVENALLVDRLWQALGDAGVQRRCPAEVVAIEADGEAPLRLRDSDGGSLRAGLLLVADGADSPTRERLGIGVDRHDYRQQGLVAYVRSAEPHAASCYQRFLPGGPLAFLPCADGRCSIVWSLPDAEAQRLLAIAEAGFLDALERAFEGRLGRLGALSARRAFPLRRQLAQRYVAGRALLLGDAAHVVHPLAGQGVNLGLRDVAALRAHLRKYPDDPGLPWRLARLGRERRSENALAAYAFEALQRGFSNADLLPTLLRGPLLGVVDRLGPVKRGFWRRAAGSTPTPA
jgi:3-demethoxyubiquinol 3-hydroxylase